MKSYCIKKCPIGKRQAARLLKENDSVLDAAAEMQTFTNTCYGCKRFKKNISYALVDDNGNLHKVKKIRRFPRIK